MGKASNTPAIRLTEAAYALLSTDVRGIWTTEREDLPSWPEVRDQYLGKRTYMQGHRLLIEGCGLEIVPNRHPHDVLMRIVRVLETLQHLNLHPEWVQLTADIRRSVTGIASAIEFIDKTPLGEEVSVRLSYPGGRFAMLTFDMSSGDWTHFIASDDVQDDLHRLKEAL